MLALIGSECVERRDDVVPASRGDDRGADLFTIYGEHLLVASADRHLFLPRRVIERHYHRGAWAIETSSFARIDEAFRTEVRELRQ